MQSLEAFKLIKKFWITWRDYMCNMISSIRVIKEDLI